MKQQQPQQQKKHLNIFMQYVNNTYKLISFNSRKGDSGNIRYLPPVSKEWKNNVYTFNPNTFKNYLIYNMNIDKLIKSYFNSYFKLKFIKKVYRRRRHIRKSLYKIFASKAEIKHNNNKAIITIYTYNKEKLIFLKKIQKLKRFIQKRIFWICLKTNKIFKNMDNRFRIKLLRKTLRKQLRLLRIFKLTLNLNKYKFEETLLTELNFLISEFYHKKVEFNIVNLKSIMLNSDLFTKILTLKLKNTKSKGIRIMNILLNKFKLPILNSVIERSNWIRSVNHLFIENKYKNLHLTRVIKSENLDNKLNQIYNKNTLIYNNTTKNLNDYSHNILSNNYNKIHRVIFNSIKYKNMYGIRLETKGRLTRRYRADKAVFSVKWKGGLKNGDASYRGLSSVVKRGYLNSNVEYSIFESKRRIGAFAVKGWVSGR